MVTGVLSTLIFFGAIALMNRGSMKKLHKRSEVDVLAESRYIDKQIKRESDLADSLLTDLIMRAGKEKNIIQ